jgi:hypothetical protein
MGSGDFVSGDFTGGKKKTNAAKDGEPFSLLPVDFERPPCRDFFEELWC